ncbi:MAG: hypothetical protein LBS50_09805 [Prevotellaceae bacterium]|jgi:hypothetical protein|nr:hypothetical protein [Prevotellaceae bacterium]
MEQKHTVKEIQDCTVAEECLIMTIGWCNNIRNHSSSEQDVELVDFYITGLHRLLDSIRIGSSYVQEVLDKYPPLIKNNKLDMNFIKNEYHKLRPFVQNTIFNKMGQPIRKYNNMDFIHTQTAPVILAPVAV